MGKTTSKTSDETSARLEQLVSDLAKTSTSEKWVALLESISDQRHLLVPLLIEMKDKAGILYLSTLLSSTDMEGIFTKIIKSDDMEFPFVLAFSEYNSNSYQEARREGMKAYDYDEESLQKMVDDEKDEVLYDFLKNYVSFVEFEGPDGEKERAKRLDLVGTILENGEYTWFRSYGYWTDLMNQYMNQ